MIELLPGLYRIESALGGNLLALHLIRGERTLLIDSGVRDTPDTVIFPAFERAGLPPHIDMLLVSHADADHHGGNAAVRARVPNVTILAHEIDRPRIESKAAHLAGRYTDVVAADDLSYAPELLGWLDAMIGADTPVDLSLRGGETISLDARVRWHVLHAPGHSAGHLALWEPETRVLIAQDAVLWRGVPDRAGQLPSPPPYDDVDGYLATLQQLRALEPEWLLTAHYPIIRGADVDAFFAESLAFVGRVDAVVLDAVRAANRPLTLSDVAAALDARLGPFAVAIQWVGPALAHLGRHVAAGRLALQSDGAARAWVAVRRQDDKITR
jgi:glyoxylase-like metal-dependent hydrolase (beta-lactamase superfamily II)